MPYVITSNPDNQGRTWTCPLWLANGQFVGMLRAGEADRFDSREDAQSALDRIPDRIRAFHDLAVATDSANLPPASFGTQGWMKGHPGYDLA